MGFQIDAEGIIVDLCVKDYRKSTKDNWDDLWCRCDFSFRSGNWLNYQRSDDAILLSSEIDELESSLTQLINNEITDVKVIEPIEPDFKFVLYPQEDITKNPKCVYVKPGCEIVDILLEWKVYFWEDGITDNHLSVTLDRDKITELRDYLRSIVNRCR